MPAIERSDTTPPGEMVEILREAIRQGDESGPGVAADEVFATVRQRIASQQTIPKGAPVDKAAFYDWLASRRLSAEGSAMTSVELLDLIYDEPQA